LVEAWEASSLAAQDLPWYVQAQAWRAVMGVVTLVGFAYLRYLDLLTYRERFSEWRAQGGLNSPLWV